MDQRAASLDKTEQQAPTSPPPSAHPRETSRNIRPPITRIIDTDISNSPGDFDQVRNERGSSGPSLRFPRPIGNTHLAHWISTSDPDIMRITSESVNEENGLAESTYELLTHADDTASENESHYENNDENFSESVSSLDQKRSDDVHSVSEDDEDIPMLVHAPLPTLQLHPRPETSPIVASVDEDEVVEDASDINTRTSHEYTHQKLGTPSMSVQDTPRASAMWIGKADEQEKPSLRSSLAHASSKIYDFARDAAIEYRTKVRGDFHAIGEAVKSRNPDGLPLGCLLALALIQCVVIFLGGSLLKAAWMPIHGSLPFFSGGADVSIVTTTAAPQTVTSTITTSATRASTTARTDVNVRDETSTLDWIFSRDIGLSYSTVDNTFLVDIPGPLKNEWLSKDCVAIAATREGKKIDTKVNEVEKGIAATLPRRERYGDVDFVFKSSCRPIVKQTVTVSFGSYENDLTALARQTKDLMLRIAEQQANSWSQVYDSILVSNRTDIVPVESLEKAVKAVTDRWTEASRSVNKLAQANIVPRIKKNLTETTALVQRKTELLIRDAQTQLQLGLLSSQVSARLWWLKVTRQDAEREQYRLKASMYMADKAEKAKARILKTSQKMKQKCSWRGFFDGSC